MGYESRLCGGKGREAYECKIASRKKKKCGEIKLKTLGTLLEIIKQMSLKVGAHARGQPTLYNAS